MNLIRDLQETINQVIENIFMRSIFQYSVPFCKIFSLFLNTFLNRQEYIYTECHFSTCENDSGALNPNCV